VSKLPLVQGLRAVAALSLAMVHAKHDAGALAAAAGQAFVSHDRFPWVAGVDVFFVISGFVMVHASRGLFARPGASGVFLARRVARIVPLYWGTTTLYLAVALAVPSLLNSALLEPWPVLASYLFIPFARPDGAVQPIYSLGWTLNYEMFFYALFALAVALPLRRAVAALAATLAALAAFGALFRLPQPLAFWTDAIVLEFAFGLVIGLLRAEGMTLGRIERAALALLGVALLALDFTRGDLWAPLPRVLGWGLPAALIVAAAALGRERAPSANWATRLAVATGDASYALYLLHPFVIRGGRAFAMRTGLADVIGPWGFVALSLLAATVAALFVHRWFERPATERARRRLERSSAEKRPAGRGDAAQRQHS
jgi:exopolysaccharide production protein ExoZ